MSTWQSQGCPYSYPKILHCFLIFQSISPLGTLSYFLYSSQCLILPPSPSHLTNDVDVYFIRKTVPNRRGLDQNSTTTSTQVLAYATIKHRLHQNKKDAQLKHFEFVLYIWLRLASPISCCPWFSNNRIVRENWQNMCVCVCVCEREREREFSLRGYSSL